MGGVEKIENNIRIVALLKIRNKKLGLVINFFKITYSNILRFTNAASQIQ